MKDTIFEDYSKGESSFTFDKKVTEVFDDMLKRSIPFYEEVIKLNIDFFKEKLPIRKENKQNIIYDLGCSTGNTIYLIDKSLSNGNIHYIGIDNSFSMIEKSKEKNELNNNCSFICNDIVNYELVNSIGIILNYTLQFIEISKRDKLLKKIYESLIPGGCLFLSEKIHIESIENEALLTNLYFSFKRRNGYKDIEISNKREALKDILITEKLSHHLERLEKVGFSFYSLLFKCYNFISIVAIK